MLYRALADATVGFHLAFIVFVIVGGLLVWRRAAWAWLHLPALAWVTWLEFTHAICPLTPLENALRAQAGDAGYAGGFIQHYIEPVIYPRGLTPGIQVLLGTLLVGFNVVVYAVAWRRARRAPVRGSVT